MTDIDRRLFLGGLAAAMAAPYVVRSGILMPIRAIIKPQLFKITEVSQDGEHYMALAYLHLKVGKSPDFKGNYKTLDDYAVAEFPFRRVVFARGWTDGVI